MLLTEIATLDELLQAYAARARQRLHGLQESHLPGGEPVRRAVLRATPTQLQKMAIAAAFHDMGIWTDGTFDYLQPSIGLAGEHLARSGRPEWTPEITAMILEHHKISP